MLHVALVGSREYPRLDLVRSFVLDRIPAGAIVVSGGAPGVDRTAVLAARERNLETVVMLADWDRLGKRAGPERNGRMAAIADYVIAWWNLSSRGTRDMIAQARELGKPVRVYGPDGSVLGQHDP